LIKIKNENSIYQGEILNGVPNGKGTKRNLKVKDLIWSGIYLNGKELCNKIEK
jgi:hypothetical protein